MKEYLMIEFKISDENVVIYSVKNNVKTFECNISHNKINCNVSYDFNEKPLSLQAFLMVYRTIYLIYGPDSLPL